MNNPLDAVTQLVEQLKVVGCPPILVGGHALMHFGSDRVTKDFDFVIPMPEDFEPLARVMYSAGYRLISKFHDDGSVHRFIDEEPIAFLKMKSEKLDALFFIHPDTGAKVDLLLDFPIPASELRTRAERSDNPTSAIDVASRLDLRRMKELAYRDRGAARDAMDLLFLGATEEEVAAMR